MGCSLTSLFYLERYHVRTDHTLLFLQGFGNVLSHNFYISLDLSDLGTSLVHIVYRSTVLFHLGSVHLGIECNLFVL